jgi:hypothetical protein
LIASTKAMRWDSKWMDDETSGPETFGHLKLNVARVELRLE